MIRHDPQCLHALEQARQLLAQASDRLMPPIVDPASSLIPWPSAKPEHFPTMAEVERALIAAA